MARIEVKDLGFSYNGEPALRDLSFELDRGDFLAVIGPNGSGKSTLLKLLSGFLPPLNGLAGLNGRAVSAIPKAELARIIAYVPSELYLPYDFSVFEIVLMGRSPYVAWWRNYSESDSAIALETLREVGISALKDRSINSLSSGERQLAFIAQALAQAPEVLMLDEPTSHLDINYKMQIFELLARLSTAKKMAVAVVSHDLAMLAAYVRKVLILKKGGPVFFGPAKEGLSPANIAAAYGISDAASVGRLLGR
ncbi:MAG: ABC transporter ATP-binding protein [Elusimicrobia bacterium]|nr:ABC transporter ATP-binding protein [Elusimicrobiota bacterium]